jgi:hypothetical protein
VPIPYPRGGRKKRGHPKEGERKKGGDTADYSVILQAKNEEGGNQKDDKTLLHYNKDNILNIYNYLILGFDLSVSLNQVSLKVIYQSRSCSI